MSDKKRVLVLCYSQTGQTKRAAEALVAPLARDGFAVVWQRLRPEQAYPFPWGIGQFFDVMPESVLGIPPPLEPLSIDADERFDLVILAYQVWHLSPSLPAQSFFASPYKHLVEGANVITLIACRNMWYRASRRMEQLIRSAGGVHVGNVVVTDQGPTWATLITTPRWLLTGKNNRFWRIFPPAGVDAEQISGLERFGRALVAKADLLGTRSATSIFDGLKPATVDERMVVPELLAGVAFGAWARVLVKVGGPGALRRRALIVPYVVWLIGMIVVVLPLAAAARILLRPIVARALVPYVQELKSPGAVSNKGS